MEVAQANAEALAAAKSFLARHGLTADALTEAVRADEHGRPFNTTIVFGGLVEGLSEKNEKERAPRVLSHLQRALTPQPSGRWMPLMMRRTAQIKRDLAPIRSESFAGQTADARGRPAVWLKAFVETCDAEIRSLEQRRAEAQAKMHQAEKDLEPLQARINAFLRDNATRRTVTHLIEFLTTLLQVVDRGVGLTAVVLMAERLVNDREAHALNADAAAAAFSILQEVRAQAQAERERIAQFRADCEKVLQQIDARRADAQARLVAHPYADVDLTDAALVERVQAQMPPAAAPGNPVSLIELDDARLYHALYEQALARASERTAALSLLELMEMQAADLQSSAAESPAAGDDLVAATLEAAYHRIGGQSIDLDRKAAPQNWWLVGVPDETNPGFSFENATLVGTGRRDQAQFLHVQVGIAPNDLVALAAARQPFEQALAQRNYYVLEALALDDHARQVFALGLASGVIAVRGGAFSLASDNGDEALGATVEEALDRFSQSFDLTQKAETRFNALPLSDITERLETYLTRGRSVQDEMWWEFASYVRDRLELARHQMTFAN